MTAALAQELPVGLAAVALNPGIIDTRMLRSCFGEGAGSYQTPEAWAKAAVRSPLDCQASLNPQSGWSAEIKAARLIIPTGKPITLRGISVGPPVVSRHHS